MIYSYDDLLADSHSIYIGGRTTSLLLNVRRTSDVRQIEIHAAELIVSDPALLKLKLLSNSGRPDSGRR
jgi:hypothetical protein